MLAQGERYEPAIRELQEALKINPASAEAHFNLGNVFANCGRFDEAAAEYCRALALVPDYEDAQRNLDAVLSRINGNRSDADTRP